MSSEHLLDMYVVREGAQVFKKYVIVGRIYHKKNKILSWLNLNCLTFKEMCI